MASNVTPMRIGDELVITDDANDVHSPFDGSVVGAVPTATEAHIDEAVAIAGASTSPVPCRRTSGPPSSIGPRPR